MKRRLGWAALLLAALMPQAGLAASGAAVQALKVRPHIFLLTVDGQNVALQTGPDGAVVVDTGPPGAAAALIAAIKRITSAPIRFVIDTSASLDRTGGNAPLSAAGQAFGAQYSGFGNHGFVGSFNAPIIAQANVLLTMSNAPPGTAAVYYPRAAFPSLTYSGRQYNFYLNGEGIEVISMPAAHSDGDSVVLFRRSDVLVVGDILDMERFPIIDLKHGGTVQGEIRALNRLLNLVIPVTPLFWEPGGTIVIPARGRLGQQLEVVQYRDMLTIVRDRIQALINQGKTLAQVQAADPTAGYNARYGASSGPWTTAQFVRAVYQSLVDARSRR